MFKLTVVIIIVLQGDTIYAIGIGNNVNDQQQLILAGDYGRVYHIDSFDALNADFEHHIIKDVCENGTIVKFSTQFFYFSLLILGIGITSPNLRFSEIHGRRTLNPGGPVTLPA